MAAKLYLVDGMSHIYRAYYAIQGLTDRQGRPTNAVYGFTNMLRKLIDEEKPEYLGVAIDLFGPTVRHDQYEEYKATRRPTPDDLKEQIPHVLKVCEVLRVPVLSYERYEADDVIGTLAAKAKACGLDVVVVTIDKDMFQLVDDQLTILDTRTMLRLDPRGVEKKFGVPPQRVVDVLSLVGDSSDNIPGAPGIGEKGARQLISEHGSLEELLANRDGVARKTYRESLQTYEAQILQSRDLVTIHQNLDIDLNLEELRLSEPDRKAARELFQELEFVSLLEEFLPSSRESQGHYEVVDTQQKLHDLVQSLRGRTVAVSAHLTDLRPTEARLESLAVTDAAGRGWFVSKTLVESYPEQVGNILSRPAELIVHDLKPLLMVARRQAWQLAPQLQDTMLMAYLVRPNATDFSLEKLCLEYLHYRLEQDVDRERGLFEDEAGPFLAEGADQTLQLYLALGPVIREHGMEDLLNQIEIPLIGVLAAMEQTGVRVDTDLLNRMSQELGGEIEGLSQRICEIAGGEFNINSPKQLAEVLFEKLNLPVVKKTRKAGHYATGVEVLEALAEDYEVVRLILEYRELTKLRNTYLEALPKLVSPQSGRIHTSYNQMVAATGRLSSSNPNLQNIPVKSELGRKIRRAFVAQPGCQILAADYSQIELRVMAHLSGDPVLVEAFRKGEDIHERTAREVFGMNAVMDPAKFRRHAKVINFGIMYGLSAFGLAQSLKIERKQAQQFIDDYFQRYQGVKAWIDDTLERARETGYVKTLFGRIRQIPELRSKNWNLRNFGERTAINAPIQGTAADLIKKAMVLIQSELETQRMNSRLIMQVHDELVFEVADTELERLENLVVERMEHVADLVVPLKVDLGVGPSWYEAK